jgi:hypothetical protein
MVQSLRRPKLAMRPPGVTLVANSFLSTQHTETNATAEKDALKEAEELMKALREQGDKGKETAINEILEGVRDANPTPPSWA